MPFDGPDMNDFLLVFHCNYVSLAPFPKYYWVSFISQNIKKSRLLTQETMAGPRADFIVSWLVGLVIHAG